MFRQDRLLCWGMQVGLLLLHDQDLVGVLAANKELGVLTLGGIASAVVTSG